MRDCVATVEWPAQAEGRMVDQDSIHLNGLNKMALTLHPSGQADGDLHSLLIQAVERLWDARQERLLAAQTTIPGIVWFVLILGGGSEAVAFGSFLGAPSLWMQLAMSAVLAASGILVLILIIALSNPFRGDFRVSRPRHSSMRCRGWKPRRDNNNSERPCRADW